MCVTMETNLLPLWQSRGRCVSFLYDGLFFFAPIARRNRRCVHFSERISVTFSQHEEVFKLKAHHVCLRISRESIQSRGEGPCCSWVLLGSQKSEKDLGRKIFQKERNIPLFSTLILVLSGKT